jgi:adenylosuccinate lyase
MNISPIDGRYSEKIKKLGPYFSEYALIKTRIEVEIEYLIFLSLAEIKGLRKFSSEEVTVLRSIYGFHGNPSRGG